jgi:hypothetical protein
MNFLLNFLFTKKHLEQRGVANQRASELGLVSGLMPGPTGLVMGVLLGRREEPAPPAASPPPDNTDVTVAPPPSGPSGASGRNPQSTSR